MAFERTPRLKSSLRHPSTRPIIIERKAPEFLKSGWGIFSGFQAPIGDPFSSQPLARLSPDERS
jgi:hypothetical protein